MKSVAGDLSQPISRVVGWNGARMRIETYLERIGYTGPRAPTPDTLRRLHRAHLIAIPFENLDIHLGTPITLSVPAFYEKIVERRRGGFCYELNGLFGWLLDALGYRVALLSARVYSDGQYGPEFDHLVLLIEGHEQWIADVGFGDSFMHPLRLEAGRDDEQAGWRYGFALDGSDWILQRYREPNAWVPQYRFSLVPRRLDEFAAQCRYHQTSPESHFTQKAICSMATERGRITVTGNRLIRTESEQRDERAIRSAEDFRATLASDFGMTSVHELAVDRIVGK